jgi:hypothetical protein
MVARSVGMSMASRSVGMSMAHIVIYGSVIVVVSDGMRVARSV